MPKGGKKGVRKSNIDIASDIKLSDFADSSSRNGRLRKSIGNSLNKEQLKDFHSIEEETLWFEKDLEEFQLLGITTEDPKKQLRTKVTPEGSLYTPGIQYPIDVWFLIGGFIKPEEVKLFAAICKDSYHVSRSYSFWIKMYKRYYEPSNPLPPRLQPECIEQAFCLKTCVIRALYYMYPQFKSQISNRLSNLDVYCLSNLCCTLMWRMQQNGKWIFHFKFQTSSSPSGTGLTYGVAIKDLWASQDSEGKNQEVYVNHNPDEGSKILRFSCSHFVAVPQMVMGSRLANVRINLAHDMRRHKLQLTFCRSSYVQLNKSASINKGNGGYNDVVEFDAVDNLMVLNWWHPQYPFDYNF